MGFKGWGAGFAAYVHRNKQLEIRSAFLFCFPCVQILGVYVLQAQTFAAPRAVVGETSRAIATVRDSVVVRACALAVTAAVVDRARV